MGFFSGARYFSSHDGKRPEKIESETIFSTTTTTTTTKRTEMREKKEQSEQVRILLRNWL